MALTIERYVYPYNQHLQQQAPNHKTPIQALKEWRKTKPVLLKRGRLIVRDWTFMMNEIIVALTMWQKFLELMEKIFRMPL